MKVNKFIHNQNPDYFSLATGMEIRNGYGLLLAANIGVFNTNDEYSFDRSISIDVSCLSISK